MSEADKKTSENVDICLLLDFYGQLLTEKAREILELHYAEDMSLAEISEQYDITRQAVHDMLKRGTASLYEYEEKLSLVSRFAMQQQCIQEAIRDIDNNQPLAAKEKLAALNQLL